MTIIVICDWENSHRKFKKWLEPSHWVLGSRASTLAQVFVTWTFHPPPWLSLNSPDWTSCTSPRLTLSLSMLFCLGWVCLVCGSQSCMSCHILGWLILCWQYIISYILFFPPSYASQAFHDEFLFVYFTLWMMFRSKWYVYIFLFSSVTNILS